MHGGQLVSELSSQHCTILVPSNLPLQLQMHPLAPVMPPIVP